jgi:transposase InsO family protein
VRIHRDRELLPLIRDIFWRHKRRYGARRIAQELCSMDERCGVARVARLLKTEGLRAIQPKSFRPRTTESRHRLGYSPNLVQGRAAPVRIDEVWVGDITYIPLRGGTFGYLSLLMDLFSRRIACWDYAASMTEPLVLSSLHSAIRNRPARSGFDSSHGSRRAVCGEQVSGRIASCGDASEHERRGELLRQCVHGIVLWDAQDGVGIERVRRWNRSDAGAVELHALLQYGTSSFIAGVRLPGGL